VSKITDISGRACTVSVCVDPGTTHGFASDALSGISLGLGCADGEPDGRAEADAGGAADAAGAELDWRLPAVAAGFAAEFAAGFAPEFAPELAATPGASDDDAAG
jgi:hypothetical protein